MLTAPLPVQKAIETINEAYKRDLQNDIAKAQAIYDAWLKLKAADVKGIPDELSQWQCRWGFTVDVEEPKEWGKIHKAIGKLEVSDKTPVEPPSEYDENGQPKKKRGKKVQMIRLRLSPPVKHLNYNIMFTVERKLSKNDKCQVKVVTSKRTEVVCSVK